MSAREELLELQGFSNKIPYLPLKGLSFIIHRHALIGLQKATRQSSQVTKSNKAIKTLRCLILIGDTELPPYHVYKQ